MILSPEKLNYPSPSIAVAEATDTPEITDVFTSARAGMDYIDPNLHTRQETLEWIGRLIADDKNTVLKAISGEKIVGFCVLHDGWLDHMYVSPDSQGRGIGSTLLHEAQSLQPELQLWVFQQNTGAIRLYERNGFTLVETTDGSGNEERVPDARYIWKREG